MSQNNDNQLGKRFLKEALPLISTYFSGESVGLAGASASIGQEADEESIEFGQHIRFRHAIACCAELFPIVQRIESGLSSVTDTTRTETRGGDTRSTRYTPIRCQEICVFFLAEELSYPSNYGERIDARK